MGFVSQQEEEEEEDPGFGNFDFCAPGWFLVSVFVLAAALK